MSAKSIAGLNEQPSGPTLDAIPGSYGFPFIGPLLHAREWKSDHLGFYRNQIGRYGSTVFKTSFIKKAIAVTDKTGIENALDLENTHRITGFNGVDPHPEVLRHSPVVFIGDNDRAERVRQFIIAYTESRKAFFFPVLEETIRRHISEWEHLGEFSLTEKLSLMMLDFYVRWLLDYAPDLHEVDHIRRNIVQVRFRTGMSPKDKVVKQYFETVIQAYQSSKAFARVQEDARLQLGYDGDHWAREIAWMTLFNASNGAYFSLLSCIAEVLSDPEIVTAIRTRFPEGTSNYAVLQDPLLQALLNESLRLHTPVPRIYASAKRDFILTSKSGSYPVKKGEVLQCVLAMAHRAEDLFPEPDRFNYKRFLDDGGETMKKLVWAGQSAYRDVKEPNQRTCLGKDYGAGAALLALKELVTQYNIVLKEAPRFGKEYTLGGAPANDLYVTQFRRIV
ncbi:MAG TPA: cytochrome P450 [Saprospiraceae bacterium]|nr:cytochrome P450 [Saprospiraceae bacterium]